MLLCLILLCWYVALSKHALALAVEKSHPALFYWLSTAALLASAALLLREHSNDWFKVDDWLARTRALQRFGRYVPSRAFPILVGLLAVGLVAVDLAWRWQAIRTWRIPPPWEADMMSIIRDGTTAFFAGKNPYTLLYWYSAPIQGIAPWSSAFTYLPGTWLPFALAQALGVSYAYVSVCLVIAVLAVFLLTIAHAWRHCPSVGGSTKDELQGRTVLFTCYGLMLGALFFLKHLSAIMHTSPMWFFLSLFCYLAVTRRTSAASVILGVCCATRPTAVVLIPAWLFFLYREARGRLVWKALLLVAPLAILLGPFVLGHSRQFLFSTVEWYGLGGARVWALRPDWVVNSFGFTGIFLRFGMGHLVLLTQIACQLALVLLAWKRVLSMRDCMHYMAWALLLFYMTVSIPVSYIYSECLLLISFAVLADLRHGLRLDSPPGEVVNWS